MEEEDQLSGIRSLHHELSAIGRPEEESQDAEPANLPAIDKLCIDLESHISAFRKLLDKQARNEASRQALACGRRAAPSPRTP
jgi:nuclear pore complex protein Nup205